MQDVSTFGGAIGAREAANAAQDRAGQQQSNFQDVQQKMLDLYTKALSSADARQGEATGYRNQAAGMYNNLYGTGQGEYGSGMDRLNQAIGGYANATGIRLPNATAPSMTQASAGGGTVATAVNPAGNRTTPRAPGSAAAQLNGQGTQPGQIRRMIRASPRGRRPQHRAPSSPPPVTTPTP